MLWLQNTSDGRHDMNHTPRSVTVVLLLLVIRMRDITAHLNHSDKGEEGTAAAMHTTHQASHTPSKTRSSLEHVGGEKAGTASAVSCRSREPIRHARARALLPSSAAAGREGAHTTCFVFHLAAHSMYLHLPLYSTVQYSTRKDTDDEHESRPLCYMSPAAIRMYIIIIVCTHYAVVPYADGNLPYKCTRIGPGQQRPADESRRQVVVISR
jgi:hypothetical protein